MATLRSILKYLLLFLGSLAAVMILLACTTAPFWTWYGMATKKAGINRPPDVIVLLGGGGMPSESGLIRSWYAARVARGFSRAALIIALPGDTADSLSALCQMKRELVMRGVAPERILFEDSGTNTRAQALNIFKRISDIEKGRMNKDGDAPQSIINYQLSILIVTSPEHLYRAVLAFRKAGFNKVDGIPAFEQAIESDLTFGPGKLGGRRLVPDIGGNLTVRYQFWTQMHYEMLVLREWMALGYYKLKGWI